MSELRQNLISKDWTIMAPERAKRPEEFLPEKNRRKPSPKKTCPFEDLQKSGNWPPLLSYPNEKKWEVVMIPNKYPALNHANSCAPVLSQGLYRVAAGGGYHDLIVTRDHEKNFAHLKPALAARVFLILQERYKAFFADPCLAYTSMFYNWGPAAGASLYHSHYQVVTLPIIPHNINHSLYGSYEYFKKHRECAHCHIVRYEKKTKTRVVEENKEAIAFTPFASHRPFEMRVFPKKHLPYFERASKITIEGVAALLQSVLKRYEKYLNDPDLNFFIHTSPLRNQNTYAYYHWHIEIVPKIHPPPGGFEVGTGLNINVITPERAAGMLRGENV